MTGTPMRRTGRERGGVGARWPGPVLAAGLWLLAGGAAAQPTLFYSPAGHPVVEPSYPLALPNTGTHPVDLYLDAGSTASGVGTPCNAGSGGLGGDGDETCGYDFLVEVSGGSLITGFTPVHSNTVWSDTTGGVTRLRVNAVTTNAPDGPFLGPTHVGTLQVTTGGTSLGFGTLLLVETAGADLALLTGGTRDLFTLPEPGLLWLLGSGLAGLALLHRLRR
jgi:hypothetical protein